jgi:pilus assembly protein FimV
MHLRKLTFTVGLVVALCSTWACGLGLGEITLNSTLNQPLDAEIKLLQVRNLAESDMLVELASVEDFNRFGVDRVFFLRSLVFDIQLDHPKGPLVKVTTQEPVREPYLIFLLKAESPGGGRLLREYTLLLDLPVYADEPAAPVQGVQTRSESQQAQNPVQSSESRQQTPAQAQPVQRQEEPPRAQAAPQPPDTQRPVSIQRGVDVYGPVQANDTLWEIARRVRPGTGVSIQQTMLALQRVNPEAFINGNINLLKRGQILRIPDQSEFEALDQRSAISEVAHQNAQWSATGNGLAAGAELEAAPSRPAAGTGEQVTRRGQLTLAAPGETESAGERSGTGDTASRSEALENELAIASEALDASRRDNQELNSRVLELEAQISTMQRLLEVSNKGLRALQLTAEQRRAATDASLTESSQQFSTEERPGTSAETTYSSSEEEAAQVSATIAQEVSEEIVQGTVGEIARSIPAASVREELPASQAKSPNPPPIAQPEKVVIRQTPQEQPLLDLLMANLWYLLIAGMAVLGGVVYFLHRGNQESETEDFHAEEDETFAAMFDEQAADVEALEPMDELDESLYFDAEDQAAFEEEIEFAAPVEAETGDVVGEADIYIAYGKFEQAEEILTKAIVSEPNNIDMRLKLLEVYSTSQDIEKFDHQYSYLIAMGDAGASARAAELRDSIPHAGKFEGEDCRDDTRQLESDETGFPDEQFSFDHEDFNGAELDTVDETGSDRFVAKAANEFGGSSLEFDNTENLALSDEEFDLGKEGLHGDLEGEGFTAEPADKESAESEDMASEFDLDLGSKDEQNSADTTEEAGLAKNEDMTFDLDGKFAADLDGKFAANTVSEEITALKEESDALEFNLDMDNSFSLNEAKTDSAVATEFEGGDLDLALDLDGEDLTEEGKHLTEENSDGDSDLSLEIDKSSALSMDDADIFSDLEFGAEAPTDSENDPMANLEAAELNLDSDLELDFEVSSSTTGSDADDDFGMEMGDLDLAALDQEIDALVGDVDGDLADDEVAVPSISEIVPAFNEGAGGEFNIKESSSDELDSADWSLPAEPSDDSAGVIAFDDKAFGENDPEAAGDTDDGLDGDLDFLADADEVATKLDLARAYIDMGDQEGARDILDEVHNEGNEEQRREAAELLEKIV